MAGKIPKIKFNNGHKIPMLGLGTWKSSPSQVIQAVKDAIDLGYRHIDCALFYENEKHIGKAITSKLAERVIKREELFITSKLWNTYHRPDHVEKGITRSLDDLGLKYLDLYLIHWPMGYKDGDVLMPTTAKGKVVYSKADYLDTWLAMEELVKKGLTKSVGVANFNKKQLQRILSYGSIVPVNNQVECHPYLNQHKLMEFCKSKEILITCYSPLGSGDRPWAKAGEPVLLKDEKVKKLAEKHKRTPGQIVLRYQIQRGNIVIPKSVRKPRIQENMCIFDFKLDCEDMDILNSLNTGRRYVGLRRDNRHPFHPFANDSY